jgi:REP element-mobilizing transposase RayT
MPQSLVKILVHIVFSTKNRMAIITPEIEPGLFGYIHGIVKNHDARLITANGTADHVHLLVSLGRNDVAELIGDIKRSSSTWIKKQDRRFSQFYWQKGYGVFSIGRSQVAAVSKYIADQKEHHKTQSFQDEFRVLLKKYDVDYDERFVWD